MTIYSCLIVTTVTGSPLGLEYVPLQPPLSLYCPLATLVRGADGKFFRIRTFFPEYFKNLREQGFSSNLIKPQLLSTVGGSVPQRCRFFFCACPPSHPVFKKIQPAARPVERCRPSAPPPPRSRRRERTKVRGSSCPSGRGVQ